MRSSTNINTRLLTFRYCVLQGGYWAAFCAIYAFATVLLLAKGFSGSQAGIAVALGNILGVLLQPRFAAIADSSQKITIQKLTALLGVATAASFFLLSLFPNLFLAVFVFFLLTDAFLQVTQPLVNSVSVYYVNRGVSVDFGIARGVGSVSYAAASSALGRLIEKKGADVIIFAALLFLALMILALLSMPALSQPVKTERSEIPADRTAAPENTGKRESIFSFFLQYRRFTTALLGVTLLFTFHNMTNSYLIRIVTSLGGNSASMGTALSVAAVCEIPAMLVFSKLLKRFSSSRLLMISGVFFAAKAAAYLFATTMPQFYLAQILQMGSFALYIPASVYYVNETMEDADKFKGQAVMTATNTLGGVIGSLLGGILLDYAGVTPLLVTAFGSAVLGSVLLFFACRNADTKNRQTVPDI